MNKKSKNLQIGPRVSIANRAVSSKNIGPALDFSRRRNNEKKYKFLDVAMSVWPGAVVIDWAVEGLGFGQLTYSISGGKLSVDDECMSDKFVKQLQAEVIARHKRKKLKIHVADDIIEKMFDRFASDLKKTKVQGK
jgi:hypothetical protein